MSGFLFFLTILGIARAQLVPNRVYGQTNFNTNSLSDPPTASSLGFPTKAITDSNGFTYICDLFNNRVLRYPSGSITADRVYGQADFSSKLQPAPPTANSFREPNDICLDSFNNLYVVDTTNNRVLRFAFGSTTANLVYGQLGSFATSNSNKNGRSANTLNFPQSCTVGTNNQLYIGDGANARILRYPYNVTTADEVYGQSDYTSYTAPTTPSRTNFGVMGQIHLDEEGHLWITDKNWNRVLRYTMSILRADDVYGQSSYTTGSSSQVLGVSGTTLYSPTGVWSYGSGSNLNLFISDRNNNRILHFVGTSKIPTTIYGQPDSTSSANNNGGLSSTSLYWQAQISMTNGNLFVADQYNNRILSYGSSTNPTSTPSGNGTTPDNVCYHYSTQFQIHETGEIFDLKNIHPACAVAHTVQATGIILHFTNGYQLQVTKNHLIAYYYKDNGLVLYKKAHLITSKDKVPCIKDEVCYLKSIEVVEKMETYFGLNCLNSTVFANKIMTSTFENYHYIPAIWMKVMGGLFGIRNASKWGDSLANWAYKNLPL